jgi:hypothetical protein
VDISGITLEVDGTLRNPVVILSLGAWLLVLSAVAAAMAYAIRGITGRAQAIAGIACIALLGAGAFGLSRFVVTTVGTWIYQRQNSEIISVGFWYGPPRWLAPVAAVTVFVLLAWYTRRRERRPAA